MTEIEIDGLVGVVAADIVGFRQRFNSMKKLTLQGLAQCGVAVLTVVYILTIIRTVEHRLFMKKNHKALRQCQDHMESFGHLNFYWNYLAYDLLDHMITELAKKHTFFQSVAGEMAVYKKDLQVFRKFTPLVLFCEADPRILDEVRLKYQ